MALYDRFMLPEFLLHMKPLDDVLRTEQACMEQFYALVREIAYEADISNSVTVTREYLIYLAQAVSGLPCRLEEYPEQLRIELLFDMENKEKIPFPAVRRILLPYIPAHLIFDITGSRLDSIAEYVRIQSGILYRDCFYPRFNLEPLHLDGTWLAGGDRALNGYQSNALIDFYPVDISLLIFAKEGIIPDTEIVIKTNANRMEGKPKAGLLVRADAKEPAGTSETARLSGDARLWSSAGITLTIEKDLWHLDGSVLLDGSRLLDASVTEYKL